MLYEWLAPYADEFQIFNLFNYITFRTGGALMTSMIIAFILGPRMIKLLRAKQGKGQPIREDGPEGHIIKKAGTPTMGGLLILISVVVSTLLWGNLHSPFLWTVFMVTVGFGCIGFYDDYLKVSRQNPRGFSGKIKLILEFGIAAIACYILTLSFTPEPASFSTGLAIPLLKNTWINLGIFYIPFGCLVIVGASNAVNLTDGLDGLAILPTVMVGAALGLCAYFAGNVNYSEYLSIPYVIGAGELVIFSGALVGAGVGFLWFNTYPAQVFMGDVGSLALGAALGTMAVITRQEIIFFIMGGIFVAETMSVILQVGSFKLTGKRIFRMAPLHHHYELKGWPEPRVIVRFWIITLLLVLAGLATLKIR